MLTAALLCAALHADLPPRTAARGCRLAPHAVAAATAVPGTDAAIILAIALHESGFRVHARNGVYCGAWQISSRYGVSCAALMQPAVAARRAAVLLAWFARHRPQRDPLESYGGCRRGCRRYVEFVRGKAAKWSIHGKDPDHD